jgi:hypothetical protein
MHNTVPKDLDLTHSADEAERNVQAVSVLTCSPGPGASSFFSASQQRALILNTKTFAVERDLAKECEGVSQTIPLCCGANPTVEKFRFRFRIQIWIRESPLLPTVLRIHDILGWIRIRGSMPLTNGSGSGSCYFRH